MNITGPHKIAALLKRTLKFQWAVFGEDHYILIRKKNASRLDKGKKNIQLTRFALSLT